MTLWMSRAGVAVSGFYIKGSTEARDASSLQQSPVEASALWVEFFHNRRKRSTGDPYPNQIDRERDGGYHTRL